MFKKLIFWNNLKCMVQENSLFWVNFDDNQNLAWFGRDFTDHRTGRTSFNIMEKLKSPSIFLSLHYEK